MSGQQTPYNEPFGRYGEWLIFGQNDYFFKFPHFSEGYRSLIFLFLSIELIAVEKTFFEEMDTKPPS